MNALAGAYAEQVPVVHIVGSPPLKKRSSGQSYVLHHSLGNHDYGVFSRMYESISVAQLTVSDPLLAAQQIDDILLQCWRQSRPVYIEIPTDMVAIKIEGAQLQSPIQSDHPRSDPISEAAAMGPVVDALNAAHSPCILVGMVAYRRKVMSCPVLSTTAKKSDLLSSGCARDWSPRRKTRPTNLCNTTCSMHCE